MARFSATPPLPSQTQLSHKNRSCPCLQRYFGTRRRTTSLKVVLAFVFLIVAGNILYAGPVFYSSQRFSLGRHHNYDPDGGSNFVDSFNPAVDDNARVWEWEISSGHYPSRDLPTLIAVALPKSIPNPALPNDETTETATTSHPSIIGSGFQRRYIDPRTISRFHLDSSLPSTLFPKRPPPGSIADFDKIMQKCDYSGGRTTRDCLEFLRLGSGLDDSNILQKKVDVNQSSYIYIEEMEPRNQRLSNIQQANTSDTTTPSPANRPTIPPPLPYYTFTDLLINSTHPVIDANSIVTNSTLPCDPNHPRIFHLFWSGPFTSHPYMTILSFLYTQNTGLTRNIDSSLPQQPVCRSKLWVWVWDPNSLSADKETERQVHRMLASNIWSSPFLHSRFQDVVEFKFWNLTAQLDAMGDILEGWREALGLTGDVHGTTLKVTNEGRVYEDKSNSKFLTIVSDLARFVITYLYGGIYIDADTVFLRDWEELWGYRGAFAYRWSHIKNEYNTAVLKMNKESMLGNVLIRAAKRGSKSKKWWDWSKKSATGTGMEFHPKEGISKYVDEMDLGLPVESNGRKGLLWMLPVALFDPAWLATDGYEAGRMAIPGFTNFDDFFETPDLLRHEAELLGFDGFFRGAYSYHWHNQWKTSFDEEREQPDWGHSLLNSSPRHSDEPTRSYPSNLNLTYISNTLLDSRALPTSQPKWTCEFWNLLTGWFWPKRHCSVTMKGDASLSWSAILKRTMEAFMRGEAPNLYGEYFVW